MKISPTNAVRFSMVIIITPLYSYDMVTKALLRVPYALRKKFYKFANDLSFTDGNLNLIMFERWLEKQLKAYFNLIVDITEITSRNN